MNAVRIRYQVLQVEKSHIIITNACVLIAFIGVQRESPLNGQNSMAQGDLCLWYTQPTVTFVGKVI